MKIRMLSQAHARFGMNFNPSKHRHVVFHSFLLINVTYHSLHIPKHTQPECTIAHFLNTHLFFAPERTFRTSVLNRLHTTRWMIQISKNFWEQGTCQKTPGVAASMMKLGNRQSSRKRNSIKALLPSCPLCTDREMLSEGLVAITRWLWVILHVLCGRSCASWFIQT